MKFKANRKLGDIYQGQGRVDKAIEAYKTAHWLKPYRAEFYNTLWVHYIKLSSYDKAIQSFQSALRLRPDFAEARWNLENVRSLRRRVK